MMFTLTTTLLAAASLVVCHGDHGSGDTFDSWAAYHMAEEHHVTSFDATSFFTLHDFNSDGYWTVDEVRRLYGLDDESLKDTAADVKDKAVLDVFDLFDPSHSGRISKDAYLEHTKNGKKLPDFGLGSGHHGDDEYEYEIHHFEKFHDENTREEDLIHPEDIEHFRKHDDLEREQERIDNEQKQQIVVNNIPLKFRKQQ